MQVGCLGKKIVFETGDSRILTYTSLNKTVKGRWAKHEVIMQKPKKEFLGPDLQQVTFEISVNKIYGVNPDEIIAEIERIVESGEVVIFVLGGRLVGSGNWTIEEASESYEKTFVNGQLMSAKISLTLEEYF